MTKQLQDVYIVVATRSPTGKAPKGTLKNLRPDDLLVTILKSAVAQVSNLDPALIEDATVGCAIPEVQQGLNVVRIGTLLVGLPNPVGGVTVNRFCASGLTAVAMAADRIWVGESDVMITAGVEPMSIVLMTGNSSLISPEIFTRDESVGIVYSMGLTAEKVAQQWKTSRKVQDASSLASHQKALATQQAGEFEDEITLIEIIEKLPNLDTDATDIRTRTMSLNEGPRVNTSAEGLGKLRVVFANKGSVAAGNSSQTSDDSDALILVSKKILKQLNLVSLVRLMSFVVRGVLPEIMRIGPKEAIPAALKAGGLMQDQIDWVKLNEAFATQSLAVIQDLGLDTSKTNPLGGAIALGHPLGTTDVIRAVTVVHGLRRRSQKCGMVAMCVGTGMDAVGTFERT